MTPLRQRMIEDMKLRNSRPGPSRSTSNASPPSPSTSASRPSTWAAADVRAYLLFLVQEKQRLLELLRPGHRRPAVPLPSHPRQGMGRG